MQYRNFDEGRPMQCLACGRELRSVTYLHLKSCSGMTLAAYRERFPGTPLRDADVIASTTRRGAANGRFRGRSGRTCDECERPISRKTRGTRCVRCRDFSGEANPFHGHHHDAETRARMKAAAVHRDRATYRGGGGDPKRLSTARARWWAGIEPDRRAALLARFIVAGQANNRRSRQTRIEQIVRSWLDERAISFSQNVQVGRYNLDFLIGSNLAVESYGDFWHCNPDLYAPDWYNGSLHMTAAAKWGRDAKRPARVFDLGIRTLVLWERQIRHHPQEAIVALEAFLEQSNEVD